MSQEIEKEKPVRISIIIPALNEEGQIERVIHNVRENSRGDAVIEVLVADGGSRDRTVELAERAGARVVNCDRSGRAEQMNIGASEANGEIFYFLHADTIPPAGYDYEIIHAVKTGAQSGCFQLRFDGDHPLLRFYSWCTAFKTTLFRFGDQSLFVTANIFRQVGGFDEDLVVMEDQEMVGNLKKVTQFVLLSEKVITSSRKYEKNGVIRLQIIFSLILILYYLGARQDTLFHLYHSLIKS